LNNEHPLERALCDAALKLSVSEALQLIISIKRFNNKCRYYHYQKVNWIRDLALRFWDSGLKLLEVFYEGSESDGIFPDVSLGRFLDDPPLLPALARCGFGCLYRRLRTDHQHSHFQHTPEKILLCQRQVLGFLL